MLFSTCLYGYVRPLTKEVNNKKKRIRRKGDNNKQQGMSSRLLLRNSSSKHSRTLEVRATNRCILEVPGSLSAISQLTFVGKDVQDLDF